MDLRTEPHSSIANDDDRPASPLSLDARTSRPPRLPSSITHQDAGHAAVELASIMTVASNPVSPGPSSPPLDQVRTQDFVPPTRPSSTPFPQPEMRTDGLRCLSCPTDDDNEEDVGACEDGNAEGEDKAGNETIGVYTAGLDRMDIDPVDEDDGEAEGEEDDSFLSSLVAEPGLAPTAAIAICDMDMTMSTTPPLSPISTIATSVDSPEPQLDSSMDCSARDAEKEPPMPPSPSKEQTLFLHHLPIEIQELILDHVFDCRVSPMAKSSPDKRLTKLACISPVWRALIQERLYCYIKLKATGGTLSEALIHFAQNSHLRSYVKHVELWFPVFQPKTKPPALSATSLLPTVTHEGLTNASYILPSDNCSLEEAFYFLSTTFPELSVLTLEGGERKKAPQVRHFMRGVSIGTGIGASTDTLASATDPPPTIPPITTVRTLVCKGQWNLIRSEEDFQNIAAALPNMHEWHASYSKPKSKSYLTMATILPHLPANLTTLDLCLEGDYRQEISFPPYFLKVSNKLHFCSRLAEATPALQHLSYTGRVCRAFFDVAARLADPRTTRLKSVDLTVKNCCRHVNHWHESGSGITDLNFIRAFEALVLSAVRSMARLTELEHLRIRYVDLEFPVPPLNPFFLVHDGWASGVWSDTIVAELNRVRPETRWEELSDTFGEMTIGKDGRMVINPEFPKRRVVSLKLSNYAFLAALATM